MELVELSLASGSHAHSFELLPILDVQGHLDLRVRFMTMNDQRVRSFHEGQTVLSTGICLGARETRQRPFVHKQLLMIMGADLCSAWVDFITFMTKPACYLYV